MAVEDNQGSSLSEIYQALARKRVKLHNTGEDTSEIDRQIREIKDQLDAETGMRSFRDEEGREIIEKIREEEKKG